LARPSIIHSQKPARKARRKNAVLKRRLIESAIKISAATAICAVVYFLPSFIANRMAQSFRKFVTKPVKTIEFMGGESGALSDFDRTSLSSRILSAANAGHQLRDLAQLAATAAPLARTSIVRLAPDRIALAFDKRIPSLRAGSEGSRLVDADGYVYGSCCVLPGQEEESALPVLEGITVTTGTIDPLIREAVELKNELQGVELTMTALRFHPHRGYVVVMQPDSLEVAMGRSPFADKVSRLTDVLRRVDRERISRIELDYHGKAFIKERKL
jgi:hypothetical protein